MEGLISAGSDDFYVSTVVGERSLISEVFEAVVEDFGAGDGFFGPIFGWFGDLPSGQDGAGLEQEVPVELLRLGLLVLLYDEFRHRRFPVIRAVLFQCYYNDNRVRSELFCDCGRAS